MAKHTPGPWVISATDDTVVIDATGREVAAIDGDYNDPDTWPQMEANARLIAAAPELLEAARAAYEWLDNLPIRPSGCTDRMLALYYAISNAEGRND